MPWIKILENKSLMNHNNVSTKILFHCLNHQTRTFEIFWRFCSHVYNIVTLPVIFLCCLRFNTLDCDSSIPRGQTCGSLSYLFSFHSSISPPLSLSVSFSTPVSFMLALRCPTAFTDCGTSFLPLQTKFLKAEKERLQVRLWLVVLRLVSVVA